MKPIYIPQSNYAQLLVTFQVPPDEEGVSEWLPKNNNVPSHFAFLAKAPFQTYSP
jgi:hypothetical protein